MKTLLVTFIAFCTISFANSALPTIGDDFGSWSQKQLANAQRDNRDMAKFLKSGKISDFESKVLALAVKAACDSKCNRFTCSKSEIYEWCNINCGGGNNRMITSCEGQHNASMKKKGLASSNK